MSPASGTSVNDIQLKGVNTGNNIVRGVISDGDIPCYLTKLNSGTWILAGTNTYTKNTRINEGTLIAAIDAPNGAPGAFGNSTIDIFVGDRNKLDGNAALLMGSGCTINHKVWVNELASGKAQTATLGGANTTGLSRFDNAVTRHYRDVIL